MSTRERIQARSHREAFDFFDAVQLDDERTQAAPDCQPALKGPDLASAVEGRPFEVALQRQATVSRLIIERARRSPNVVEPRPRRALRLAMHLRHRYQLSEH